MAAGNKNRREQNGVILTVYVESSSTIPSRRNRPIQARTPNPSSKYDCGYHRRAQLLAHARRLRHADSSKPEWTRTSKTSSKPNPKPKHKWKWTLSSAKLRRSFRRIFRKRERGYERISSESIDVNQRKRATWMDCRRLVRMVKGCYGKQKY